ncbi:MAG: 30S ribosomal protein S2 [Anaerolineales bacterium]|nr:30S ribosomal protein S2 [Anaerolineales bacterium]
MAVVSMKALLESGVHFGHRTNKWDPGMKPYIFTERNGIHIIDLQQTVKAINMAYGIIRDTVATGGTVMFVGTKRQAQETVRDEAVRCGMPYVTERWLGGMLTNWPTMNQRILELERLERMIATGEIERLTKKEGLMIQREINRLNIRFSGVRNMKGRPDMMFVVDVMREDAAVHEANLLDIPVIALVDTNCDPTPIDYVIPSNDDAIRAIKLLVSKMAEAVLEGKAMRKDEEPEAEMMAAMGEGEAALVRKPGRGVEEDKELEDADLLGEATLAKLDQAKSEEGEEKKAEEKEEDTPAVKAEEEPVVEAPAAEIAPAAVEETPAEVQPESEEAPVEAQPEVEGIPAEEQPEVEEAPAEDAEAETKE